MNKIPKTFRLSEQAVKHLEQIVNQTGASDTAVVEIALAHFAQIMQGRSGAPADIPEPEPPPDFWETDEKPVPSSPVKKKYRHH